MLVTKCFLKHTTHENQLIILRWYSWENIQLRRLWKILKSKIWKFGCLTLFFPNCKFQILFFITSTFRLLDLNSQHHSSWVTFNLECQIFQQTPISRFFFFILLTHLSFLLYSPPGMTWPTSCTVRAEFLSSVLTLMTPWLRPPMERMARAGSGAPGNPGLHRGDSDQTWTFPSIPSVHTVSHLPPTHVCQHTEQSMSSSTLLDQ